MDRKQIVWIGDSRMAVRGFTDIARQRIGRELARVQDGLDPADWKPMPVVGLGVREIRIRADGAYRVIYAAKLLEAIYVLHAFEKKSQKTAKRDIELARDRFRALTAASKRHE